MKTAAAIEAVTRLVVLAVMVLVYQYFLTVYLQHQPSEKAWSVQLWKRYQAWRAERERIPVPEAFRDLRTKYVELPSEDLPAGP